MLVLIGFDVRTPKVLIALAIVWSVVDGGLDSQATPYVSSAHWPVDPGRYFDLVWSVHDNADHEQNGPEHRSFIAGQCGAPRMGSLQPPWLSPDK
ncbi:MAG: hypothetical protein JNM60_05065 [Candidatus Competibacteraceae bacterium]|nr:hypothetical protein [Candidatus Competibacteraceae bacterium]